VNVGERASPGAEPDITRPRRRLVDVPTDPERVAELAASFQAADPFPSIVLDDVLEIAPADVARAFPDAGWPGWVRLTDPYQAEKRFCSDLAAMPDLLAQVIQELSGSAFLRFLEKLSGIEALLNDPHLEGGGLHASGPGGILAPHSDFHWLQRLQLYRRLNVLLYLNPAWQEDWGGCLELYRKGEKAPARTIVPAFGRMVIFRTDHHSVHGFPAPVVAGKSRHSLALYYYTAREAETFSGDTTTYWREHKGIGRLSMLPHQALLGLSTAVARLAHQLNPNTARRARLLKAREQASESTEP
jgi:hypothetical protein